MAKTTLSVVRDIRNVLSKDIRHTEEVDHDCYSGPLSSLLAAGLVRADQLPPPGKKAVSFLRGQVITSNRKRDESYLRVVVFSDGSAQVLVGVPAFIASTRRIAAVAAREKWRAEMAETARQRESLRDRGEAAAKAAMLESPARFDAGEACMLPNGTIAEVVQPYGLCRVSSPEGRVMSEQGQRFDYRFGYVVKVPGREQCFYAAGDLYAADGDVKHLRLVC